MAIKSRFQRIKQPACFVGYFGLLIYTLSGLMFQSNMYMLVGAISWAVIISGFIASFILSYRSERIRTAPIVWGVAKREADRELAESWWVGIVGRFFAKASHTVHNHLRKGQK